MSSKSKIRWAICGGGSSRTKEDKCEKGEVVGGYFMLYPLESTCFVRSAMAIAQITSTDCVSNILIRCHVQHRHIGVYEVRCDSGSKREDLRLVCGHQDVCWD